MNANQIIINQVETEFSLLHGLRTGNKITLLNSWGQLPVNFRIYYLFGHGQREINSGTKIAHKLIVYWLCLQFLSWWIDFYGFTTTNNFLWFQSNDEKSSNENKNICGWRCFSSNLYRYQDCDSYRLAPIISTEFDSVC